MSDQNLKRRGLLCVVSGPSGSGKTTLCRRFSEEDSDAVYAVSATTRAPRDGEQDGIDYFFLTQKELKPAPLAVSFSSMLKFTAITTAPSSQRSSIISKLDETC